MTDAKLTVEDLDELAFPLEFARRAGFKQVTINVDHAAALIAAARASLDLQAYDELRRGGISVGAAQQAWHMAHAACGALGLIYEETAPADIAAAVYAESAPSAPSQPAESPWVKVSERVPRDNQKVLVCNFRSEMRSGSYDSPTGDVLFRDGFWHLSQCTHWKPLEEPTNGS